MPPPAIERGTPHIESFGATANGDEGELLATHVGMEFVAAERLGFTIVPQFGIAVAENVDNERGLIASLDLQARWYGIRYRRLSMFIEAGAGMQYSGTRSFPASGTHFNFRLRAGLAGRLRITRRWDVLGGYNWLHMSTANVVNPNVGHDGPMLFIGATMALRP